MFFIVVNRKRFVIFIISICVFYKLACIVVYGDTCFALIYIKKLKCNPYGLTTISLFLKQWLFYYRVESMQVFYVYCLTSCSYFVTTLQFSGGKELDLELVSCSGYGKNGALSVLQVL